MKRLIKQSFDRQSFDRQSFDRRADNNVNNILDKINNQIDTLKNDYYILLDNFNTLFTTYGDVYQQIEQTVKLPTKQDIEALVQMQEDMANITSHLNDDSYAENYIDDSDINEETDSENNEETSDILDEISL